MGVAIVDLPDGRKARITFDSREQLDATIADLAKSSPPGKENSKQGASALEPSLWDNVLGTAKQVGGEAVRAGSEAIMGLPLMAADFGSSLNALAQGRTTLQPGEKFPSQMYQENLDKAIAPPTDTAGKVSEAVSSLMMGGVGNSWRRAAGLLTKGEAATKPAEEAAARAASIAPNEKQGIIETARQHGYVLKPSEAGGKVGKAVEGVTGSPKLSVDASIKNQRTTNRLAGEEIGLKPGERATKLALSAAKKPHNAVYKELSELGEIVNNPAAAAKTKAAGSVIDLSTDIKAAKDAPKLGSATKGFGKRGAATAEKRPPSQYQKEIQAISSSGESFPRDVNPRIESLKEAYSVDSFSAKEAVLKVRQLRKNATKNIKAPNDPEKNELGFAQQKIANAIENELQREAVKQGKTDLVSRFSQSRQALAKIYAVEAATKGNTGEVSAQALAKQLNRGAPLSGKLKVIADVANEFGEVTRDGTKLKNKVPITVLEGLPALGGAALTAAQHPRIGIPMMAGVAGRPLARKALLSKAYQDTLGKGGGKAPAGTYRAAAQGAAAAIPGQIDENGVAQ
jgi:hypothetical protein